MPSEAPLEEVRGVLRHVALVMDGNGRWAKARGLPRVEGHRQGALSCERLVRFVGKERLFPYLTLFAFSTENWARPKEEVGFLFRLMREFVEEKIDELIENGVRLRILGAMEALPAGLRRTLALAVERTRENETLHLSVALNFGGRWDVLSGAKRAVALAQQGHLAPEDLTEEKFRSFLPAAELPDPDLIVRTGGHQRLSNFFLWEAAYSELCFTETLWPDFGEEDLLLALRDFRGRRRNFGGIVE